jgi:hypothetical protein
VINSGLIAALSTTIVLAQSGLNSVVIAPGSPRPASYTNNSYSTQLTNDPSAKGIWDGDEV